MKSVITRFSTSCNCSRRVTMSFGLSDACTPIEMLSSRTARSFEITRPEVMYFGQEPSTLSLRTKRPNRELRTSMEANAPACPADRNMTHSSSVGVATRIHLLQTSNTVELDHDTLLNGDTVSTLLNFASGTSSTSSRISFSTSSANWCAIVRADGECVLNGAMWYEMSVAM